MLGSQEPGQDAQQRGFAAAVGADDGDQLAFAYAQVDFVQGGKAGGRAHVALRKVVRFDHDVATGSRVRRGRRGAQGLLGAGPGGEPARRPRRS